MEHMKTPARHHYQNTDWTCGPAVVRMVLASFGVRASEKALAREMKSNRRTGTRQTEVVRRLTSAGLRVTTTYGRSLDRLDALVRRGASVIVIYQDRDGEEGHYAPLSGAGADRVSLRDPWYGPRYALPRREFMRRWRRTAKVYVNCALVVRRRN